MRFVIQLLIARVWLIIYDIRNKKKGFQYWFKMICIIFPHIAHHLNSYDLDMQNNEPGGLLQEGPLIQS